MRYLKNTKIIVMKRLVCLLTLACILVFNSTAQNGKNLEFTGKYAPEVVGKKLGYRFYDKFKKPGSIRSTVGYPIVCAWLGSVRFAKASGDKELETLLQDRFNILLLKEFEFLPHLHHVDHNMFGCLPLELYLGTKNMTYLETGLRYADTQWTIPYYATEEEKAWDRKGYSWQTRLWIDDMFMITIVQSQAYRATGNTEYYERAAREMVMYLDELQLENGLFYHAPDVPYIWSRGDGWMAAGMAELLQIVPQDHPCHSRILEGYKLMMKTLKGYQRKSGLWNQLIDKEDFWNETSGSAMFTYAMIMGIKNGWLDAGSYTPVVRKAWTALVDHINEAGDIDSVCEGTNKKNDLQYYYDRRRNVGDNHGQAPVLWCATALLK